MLEEARFHLAVRTASLLHNRYLVWVPFYIDLIWWLQKTLDPIKVEPGYMNEAYLEALRKVLGLSEEEFIEQIKKVKSKGEREELGLPKEK